MANHVSAGDCVSEAGGRRSKCLVILLAALFLFLAADLALLRTNLARCSPQNPDWFYFDWLISYLTDRTSGRPNLRIVHLLLLSGLEALLAGINFFTFRNVELSFLFAGSPWGFKDFSAAPITPCFSKFIVYFSYICIVLAPVLAVVRNWYGSWTARFFILFVIMLSMIGWPPIVPNLVFMAGGAIVDWPRSYYLFGEMYQPYDILAVGLILAFCAYAVRRRNRRVWEVAALVVVAQLTIEYLNLLFAAAMFAAILTDGALGALSLRLREAMRWFLIIMAASIASSLAVAGYFYISGGSLLADHNVSDGIYVQNNFAWAKSVIANLASMMFPAAIIGFLAGAVAGVAQRGRRGDQIIKRDLAVLAAVTGAFLVVFGIGFFTASYPSEMGRQFMPLAVVVLLFGIRAGELALYKWAWRPRSGEG